jgi:hypothetical protein
MGLLCSPANTGATSMGLDGGHWPDRHGADEHGHWPDGHGHQHHGHWPDGPWPEADARALLAGLGVPVVPGELACSAAEAVAAAERLGYPVALKICSAAIAHKSDVGGVALSLRNSAEVRAAYRRVHAAGRAAAADGVDGVLVTAMRDGGVELLAGVHVDPTFGPVLAVGLGGIWVEVLRDVSLRVLPADRAEARRMLGELRGSALLAGARGQAPADLDALARVIALIGDAACSLGGALRSLEVNPLWVDGDQVEALDASVLTIGDPADQPLADALLAGHPRAGQPRAGALLAGPLPAGQPPAGPHSAVHEEPDREGNDTT